MKYYIIDEISSSHIKKIEEFFKENAFQSEIEKIFWIRIPKDLLNEAQYSHQDCQPHVVAVELGSNMIKLELFVRSLNSLYCECQDYVTNQQRDFIFSYIEDLIKSLDIKT